MWTVHRLEQVFFTAFALDGWILAVLIKREVTGDLI
jgi:hypothetical protein